MTHYQILYWYDIPVQVRAKGDGRERFSQPLPQRFQEAVDNAAMAAGLIGSDEYTAAFRWSEPQEREGDAREVVATVVAELDAQFPEIDWRATAAKIKTK